MAIIAHTLPPARLRRRRMGGTHYAAADKIGCHYTGDNNGLDHGGFFYTFAEVEHCYIRVVEIGHPADHVDADCLHDTTRYLRAGSLCLPNYDSEANWTALMRDVGAVGGDDDEITRHHVADYGVYGGGVEWDAVQYLDTRRWSDSMLHNYVAQLLGL